MADDQANANVHPIQEGIPGDKDDQSNVTENQSVDNFGIPWDNAAELSKKLEILEGNDNNNLYDTNANTNTIMNSQDHKELTTGGQKNDINLKTRQDENLVKSNDVAAFTEGTEVSYSGVMENTNNIVHDVDKEITDVTGQEIIDIADIDKKLESNLTVEDGEEERPQFSDTENKSLFASKPDWEPSRLIDENSSTVSSSDTSQQASNLNHVTTPSDSSSSRYIDSPATLAKTAVSPINIRPSTSSVSSTSSVFSGPNKPQSIDDKGAKSDSVEKSNFTPFGTANTEKITTSEETNPPASTKDDFMISYNASTEPHASSRWEQFTNMLANKMESESLVSGRITNERKSDVQTFNKNWVTFDDDDTSGASVIASRTGLNRRNTTVGVSTPSTIFKNPFSPAEKPTAITSTNPFSANKVRSNTLDPQRESNFRRHSANPFSFSDSTVIEEPSNVSLAVVTSSASQDNATFFADFTTVTAHINSNTATAMAITVNESNSTDTTSKNKAATPVDKNLVDNPLAKPENAYNSNVALASRPVNDDITTDTEDEIGDNECEVVPFYESSLKRFYMLLRVPEKKRKVRSRRWKKVIVGLEGPKVKLYDIGVASPYTEVSLQGCCCLTKPKFGRHERGLVHVVKLRLISYKEIRRISGKFEKVLRKTTIFKFGATSYATLIEFMQTVQSTLFQMPEYRSVGITYQKEKMTIDVLDECRIWLSTDGNPFYSSTTVRITALAFVSGMTPCTIELNDKKAMKKLSHDESGTGKSIAAMSKDELANLTSIRSNKSWIRLKNCQFHCCVDRKTYFKNAIIEFKPVDGSEFQLMRFEIPQSRPFEARYPPVGTKTADITSVLPIIATVELQNDDHHVQVTASIKLPENTNPLSSTRKNVRLVIPIPPDWRPLFSDQKAVVKGRQVQPLKVITNRNSTISHNLGRNVKTVVAINGGSVKHRAEFGGLVWDIGTISLTQSKSPTKYKLVCQTSLLPSMELPNDYGDPPRALLEFSIPYSYASGIIVRSVKIGQKQLLENCISYTSHYSYFIDMQTNHYSIDGDNVPPFTKRTIDHGCVQQ
ncbi:Stonin-2 [Trichoplax sp. H2]|nr:Stonin-2 [Trichoplax sp. H2]|eukprot:RDD38890.1 Stonin-2 [Trichoplax sp. H2]